MRKKLENHLRSHRRRNGLRQDEVGYLLGKDGPAVCNYEHSAYKPGIETVIACEVIFGKSIRELFPGIYQKVELQVKHRANELLRLLEEKETGLVRQIKLEAVSRVAGERF